MPLSDYVPQLFSNSTTNAVVLTVLPGIAYTAAAYGFLLFPALSYIGALLMAIFFASIEYALRVPINEYSKTIAGMSNNTMQIVWVIITLILSKFSEFML